MSNLRPDWREYWPIRNYLLNNQLNPESWYGFFSPKFKNKTGLSAEDCLKFINNQSNEVDVFSFSPFFDLGAWYQNSILQAIPQHPNLQIPMEGALKILSFPAEINEIVMHSGNNIFCNFFVAKPRFWKVWLEKCELIWAEAEANKTPTAKGLNAIAEGHDSPAAIKTFVIERIASLILATDSDWNVKAYNPLELPFSNGLISKERNALIQMDALKMAYALNGKVEYLNLYKSIVNLVIQKLRLE
ncbi:hypothetical protein [Polynucleobacter sp. MWH-Braz-FAM2G]|uniref:hypothetical protein n=1 Tax=Polynucleobacter sp. MWH-Braz-FAM2G TaxID=1855883 RepID=UPI001BFEEA96|nr:hypothetical protein [Polynucleobacter sp. MWH-Braz-FAM2G]QWD90898.1 hypothetical protein FD973_00720 [Polynucleobacter sp. MWH-Braz-FAM2G]